MPSLPKAGARGTDVSRTTPRARTRARIWAERSLVAGQRFMLHPNPGNGEVHLLIGAVPEGIVSATVEVHDLFGKRVHAEEIPVGGGDLDHVIRFDQDLATGMYLVTLTLGEERSVQRMVRE